MSLVEPYLVRLTSRLMDGLRALPDERRVRHARFLCSTQNADGGFSGREGGSDLYYTAFALRGLAVLDALTPEIAGQARSLLCASLRRQAAMVDFHSLLLAAALVQLAGQPSVFLEAPVDWTARIGAVLETFRTPEGGYAKVPSGPASTYHTFLVGLCYQTLGEPWPEPEETVQFIGSRQRDDGGFVELAPMRRGGTNPTAAAVGVWQLLEGVAGNGFRGGIREGAAQFLRTMVDCQGGMRANARAPAADLLSTFTGAWTLSELGALDPALLNSIRSFALQLELPDGGFRAGFWDVGTDVEYTFYGLGCLALTSFGSERRPAGPLAVHAEAVP